MANISASADHSRTTNFRGLRLYEFHPFGEAGDELAKIERYASSDAAAISQAGTIAKRNSGPVDIAYGTDGEWNDRYLTTVSPSEFHAKGFRAERLS